MSDDKRHERHPDPHGRHAVSIDAIALGDSRDVSATQFRMPSWTAILITVFFWIAHFSINTGQVIISAPGTDELLAPRALSTVAGALISLGMLMVLDRLRDRSLAARAGAALGLALAGTAVLAAVNYPIFDPFIEGGLGPFPSAFGFHFLTRVWTFAAVSAAYLALSYVLDIRDRESRIRALQTLAHSAQLRALRNQLNPHFLFNSLNSINGLISAKRVAEAEAMTENLADFLRQTLALDPQKMIPLDEELELQALYLRIEQVRFPDRLHVEIDVPAELSGALVPSLITQPLIENSIKYAIAQSASPVELKIAARSIGDRFELIVTDSGGDARPPSSNGVSMGLRNVSERLRMQFGDEAALVAEADPAGGFRNVITSPLRTR